ncbi:unnamed protein product, partial [Gongylonema pulchrum]|uniref:Glutamine-dependent NAD(+) synthetase n=1 Tax=Gongylonema pulchrum TaxID=637853 RepID=A0A183E7P1_9BILA
MWHRQVCAAVCTLNQWSLDFTGNLKRILKSTAYSLADDRNLGITGIAIAYKRGARIRVGAELEISGYMCQDHFFELDTEFHSWEVLAEIVKKSNDYQNMVIVTGMPIRLNVELYNCAVVIQNGLILLIKPKMRFCDHGAYYENRYFVRWQKPKEIVDFRLPILENCAVAFGDAILKTSDGVSIGVELCEELFAWSAFHFCIGQLPVVWTGAVLPDEHPLAIVKFVLSYIDLAQNGVDIVCNPSASFHVLGNSDHRINNLIMESTAKAGGICLYSNFRGCDGERVFYDGGSAIAQNGQLYARIPQFDIEDVCVATATLDLTRNIAFRASNTSLLTE